jgi:release factor glutamine methyltransferase
MRSEPYVASEDSALLRSALQGRSGLRCLEVGAGNGGNLIELSKRFELTVGTDVVKPMMRDWSQREVQYILADRACCFRDRTFDLVAFNPPYLSTDEVVDVAVDGGKRGGVPLKFLTEALRVVKDTGKVLILVNDERPIGDLEGECRRRKFLLTKVASRHFFYENLSVYEAKHERPDQVPVSLP